MRRPRVFFAGAATVAAVLIAIQFVPVQRTNPSVRMALEAPSDVSEVLRRACYDCHSNETQWPWYSYIAPTSWFVIGHVDRARGDLNFSEWPAFDPERQALALSDIEEQIEKGEMPLASYTLLHRDARLSAAERELLIRWARAQRGAD